MRRKVFFETEKIKKVLLEYNYYQDSFFTCTHYSKILKFYYPHLTNYYLKKLFVQLLKENFFIEKNYKNKKLYSFMFVCKLVESPHNK